MVSRNSICGGGGGNYDDAQEYNYYILLYMIALDNDTHVARRYLPRPCRCGRAHALVQRRESGPTYFSSESPSQMMARVES